MSMLTTKALTGIRKYIAGTVKYAKYKLNGSYVKTTLTDISIDSSGIVRISFMIDPELSSGTITEVQLYDVDGELWLTKQVSLNLSSVEVGFYELVKIKITEEDT